MNRIFCLLLICFFIGTISADEKKIDKIIIDIKKEFSSMKPTIFSAWQKGVVKKIDTKEKKIALTFDACGGDYGSAYDSELIEFLIKNKVPATLFINARWIDKNMKVFLKLSKEKLFEIENHGFQHKPASVNGQRIYGIQGTENIKELVEEVYLNALKIEKLTGRRPIFYRSGTAVYDDVAVKICKKLGQVPVNFNIISGDAEFNKSVTDMKNNIMPYVGRGSIIIFHMNQPKRQTKEFLERYIPLLRKKGYQFVKLEDYKDKLK